MTIGMIIGYCQHQFMSVSHCGPDERNLVSHETSEAQSSPRKKKHICLGGYRISVPQIKPPSPSQRVRRFPPDVPTRGPPVMLVGL